MSLFEIKMPKLGESITEGTITSWSVKPGDYITEDQILFEVNTAKVSAEIPSPVAGKIVELLFKTGDTVAVGTTVATVDTEAETGTETEEAATATESAQTPPPPEKSEQQTPKDVSQNEKSTETKASPEKDHRWYSPLVLQLAAEAGISSEELTRVPGTGYEGRVSKKDIQEYIEQKQKGKAASSSPQNPPATHPSAGPEEIKRADSPAPVTVSPAEGDDIREMDPVRRIIAERMTASKKISPHVTTVVEVDVSRLVRWRENIKDHFLKKEGFKLTYLPSVVEAVAKALSEFPQVNASVDGYRMIFHKHINIGMAVALPDGNLIVPVIRDADKLNLNGLAVKMEELALKARKNKLTPADIEGGTFTITNFGTFRNILGTPIINQPEVAILGVGYIEKRPSVIETPEGDAIAIRHKMYLSLSYDHRIVDGALGGNFLRRIADYLENPGR